MIRAIFQGGVIQPTEPLPADWKEGQSLTIDARDSDSIEDIDRDFAALDELCAGNDPEDERRLLEAVTHAHAASKAQVRRDMGLEE